MLTSLCCFSSPWPTQALNSEKSLCFREEAAACCFPAPWVAAVQMCPGVPTSGLGATGGVWAQPAPWLHQGWGAQASSISLPAPSGDPGTLAALPSRDGSDLPLKQSQTLSLEGRGGAGDFCNRGLKGDSSCLLGSKTLHGIHGFLPASASPEDPVSWERWSPPARFPSAQSSPPCRVVLEALAGQRDFSLKAPGHISGPH